MKKRLSALLAFLLLSVACSGLLSGMLPVITVAAADSSAADDMTFVYDFSEGLDGGVDYTQINQLRIENKQGYVTFIAEGDDPYFRFSDSYQPVPQTSDLAYAVIEYRTTASVAAGEIYTNRRTGAHWGDPGSHVTWTYIPDGEWHTAVIDASEVWGNVEGDSLYAFRLDPLSSGAQAGDTIDVAALTFFGDGDCARAYAADREATIREDESLRVAEGSAVLDFAVDTPMVGCRVGEGVTPYWQGEFTRLVADGGGEIVLEGVSVNAAFRYLQLVCRTEETDGALTVTVHSGEQTASVEICPAADGFWQSLVAELPVPEGADTFDRITLTLPGGWLDMAYLGFFEKETYPDAYVYPKTLTTHQYVLDSAGDGESLLDVGDEYGFGVTFAYDFTRYYDSVTEALGLSHVSGVTVNDLCDRGYLTVTALQDDPYFAFGADPTVTSNLMDHVVIKYRTSAAAKSGELFVNRTDGATWGDPYGETNVTWDWTADGEWQIAVIDASACWGDVYGVYLENIRFDPLESSVEEGDTIDVAYVKFFANAKAAAAYAATEYAEVDGKTVVKAPLRPVDPATVTPVVLIEGEDLNAEGGTQMKDAAYSYADGYITYSAEGSDPSFFLLRESTQVAPFMAVKYRTTAKNAGCEVFVGSLKGGPNGRSDRVTCAYTADGAWHIAIMDLREAADYDAETGRINYLRFDFLHADSGLGDGAALDVEYIAFFETAEEAEAYLHPLPVERKTYVATFMVDGKALYRVEFREGDTALEEPVVPILPGMTGVWEPYALQDADITVNAVYTSSQTYDVPDVPPLYTEETGRTQETDTAAEPLAGTGCASALETGGLAALLLAAAAVMGKKKHRC